MAHAVLGLGAAAVTVSGAVWYLPAITDLRAGDDRPISARIGAFACLAGWSTAAVLAALLFTTASWAVPGAVVAVGTAAVAVLRGRARRYRRLEQREEIRRWRALRCETRTDGSRPPQHAFLGWLLSGLLASSAIAAALLLSGTSTVGLRTVVAVSTAVAVSVTFLLVGTVRAHTIRSRPTAAHPHAPR